MNENNKKKFSYKHRPETCPETITKLNKLNKQTGNWSVFLMIIVWPLNGGFHSL